MVCLIKAVRITVFSLNILETKSNQSVPTQDKSKPETKNENIKKL